MHTKADCSELKTYQENKLNNNEEFNNIQTKFWKMRNFLEEEDGRLFN